MQAATSTSTPRQARTPYRHELRTLTYVTLDDANGGIIRNLNREGVAVQAVGALRERQLVRLRFELKLPRLRVEANGLVQWARRSGQCGIRFVDLPASTGCQIDEWIFSNLLDALSRDAIDSQPIFGGSVVSIARAENAGSRDIRHRSIRKEIAQEASAREENDGLTLSAAARPVIRLEPESIEQKPAAILSPHGGRDLVPSIEDAYANWLSRPLSGRALGWLVDGLVVLAALLLFAFIFVSIARELPPWPLTLGAATAAAVFVAATYRTMFAMFGGRSLGARLAQTAASLEEKEGADIAGRFR